MFNLEGCPVRSIGWGSLFVAAEHLTKVEVVVNLLFLCYIISEFHLTPMATINDVSPCSFHERDSKPFLFHLFESNFDFFVA